MSQEQNCSVTVTCDKNINHVIPQKISLMESVNLSLRVNRPLADVKVAAVQGGDVIAKRTLKKALPAEMISLHVPKDRILPGKELEVRIL